MKLEKNHKVEIAVKDTKEVRDLMEILKQVLPAFGVECSYLQVKYPDQENAQPQQMVWLRHLDEPQELPDDKTM